MSLKGISILSVSLIAGLAAGGVATAEPPAPPVGAAGAQQTTQLISRARGGGTPDGPSTGAVISGDRRFARIIAFESEATNLVARDTNGLKDVFAVKRRGRVDNTGAPWRGGNAILVSRGLRRAPADGASFGVSVSGDFRHPGKCVAFLSSATNLVAGDTNGKVDAFLARAPGRAPKRVSAPQLDVDADAVTVSGDCSRVSFTAGGGLYTSVGGRRARRVSTAGAASDPSYAAGNSNALVYAADGGVWLSGNGTSRGSMVAAGGRNPAFNDLKRRTVAYEKTVGGDTQIGYRDIGKDERIISARGDTVGDASSRKPVIGNSGFYVTFESDASNLGLNPSGQTGDDNGRPDSYLYTDVRRLTLVQSVEQKAVPLPGGGQNPSMSYYANYIVFDSPAPLGDPDGGHQIYLRWLGAV
jgi:hypothetical protein